MNPTTLLLLAAATLAHPPTPHTRTAPPPTTAKKHPTTTATPHDAAADADLLAACTTAGLTPHQAASIIATTSHPTTQPAWRHTAALLALGTDPHTAWKPLTQHPHHQPIAELTTLTTTTGAPLAPQLHRHATTLRHTTTTQATKKAHTAAVLIALPLTGCFLPAFLLTGLAPIIISLATNLI